MQNLKIILTIIGAFVLPFLTSFLLNWHVVQDFLARQIIVYAAMLAQFAICFLLLKEQLK